MPLQEYEYYSFRALLDNAKPIVPSESPVTDAPHAKKFKKNVDSNTWITIKNGRAMPRSMRNKPRLRRKRGFFIKIIFFNR